MADADGPVKWQAPVPFHVAVKAEHFAVGVESKIIGVAHAGAEQLAILAVLVEAQNEAAGRLDAVAETVAVIRAREQLVLGVIAMGRIRRNVIGHFREVAADDVEMFVWAEHDGVAAVLAAGIFNFLEKL